MDKPVCPISDVLPLTEFPPLSPSFPSHWFGFHALSFLSRWFSLLPAPSFYGCRSVVFPFIPPPCCYHQSPSQNSSEAASSSEIHTNLYSFGPSRFYSFVCVLSFSGFVGTIEMEGDEWGEENIVIFDDLFRWDWKISKCGHSQKGFLPASGTWDLRNGCETLFSNPG